MQKLTKTHVESLTQPGFYRDPEIRGFCVRISIAPRSGRITRSYLVNTRVKKTRKNVCITIGQHGLITTEQARIEARRLLSLLAQGIDPKAQQKEEMDSARQEAQRNEPKRKLQTVTLKELLDEYLMNRELKPTTQHDYLTFCKQCLGDWLNLPITEINRDMVQNRYLTIAKQHKAKANYSMRILRALFNYAQAVYEDHDGRPLLVANPVDRLKNARLWKKLARRQRLILPHQMPDWYQAVMTLVKPDARDLLLLEIFTGLRHCEAVSLRWSAVDFKHKTIKIEDTKNGEPLLLPITRQLGRLLLSRWGARSSETFVFPGNGRLGHLTDIRDSIELVVHRSGVAFSEHDLRRTFETTAESLDISVYTLKKLLNHKTGGDPTAGYIITTVERLRAAAQKVADILAVRLGMDGLTPAGYLERTSVSNASGEEAG